MDIQIKAGLAVLAFALSVFWIILAYKYDRKFQRITDGLDKKEYPLAEIMQVGFGFLELVRFDIHSDRSREQIKVMAEVYGDKYAAYYYWVLLAAQITCVVTLLPVAMFLGILSDSYAILLFAVAMAFIGAWYMSEAFKDKLTARRTALVGAFPNALSEITLLVNAGLPLREAIAKVAVSNEGPLYDEFRLVIDNMRNGMSEVECYRQFGERCGMKQMRKFASLVTQSLQRGGSELPRFLKDMTDEMWTEKKALVRQQAEKANSKLIVPTVLIFLGIIAMIIIPILSGL